MKRVLYGGFLRSKGDSQKQEDPEDKSRIKMNPETPLF